MEKFKKEVSVSCCDLKGQINQICYYFKEEFKNIHQVGNFLQYKIGEKIASSLNAVIKKFAEQEIKLDIDLVIGEFNANTYLQKLAWAEDILLEKYGHLIYSQNIRTISAQFKKILISKFGAVEVKIENVTRTNVTKLLNDILANIKKVTEVAEPPLFFGEILSLIKAYGAKYNLALKK